MKNGSLRILELFSFFFFWEWHFRPAKHLFRSTVRREAMTVRSEHHVVRNGLAASSGTGQSLQNAVHVGKQRNAVRKFVFAYLISVPIPGRAEFNILSSASTALIKHSPLVSRSVWSNPRPKIRGRCVWDGVRPSPRVFTSFDHSVRRAPRNLLPLIFDPQIHENHELHRLYFPGRPFIYRGRYMSRDGRLKDDRFLEN
jgi:hypothetical protein